MRTQVQPLHNLIAGGRLTKVVFIGQTGIRVKTYITIWLDFCCMHVDPGFN